VIDHELKTALGSLQREMREHFGYAPPREVDFIDYQGTEPMTVNQSIVVSAVASGAIIPAADIYVDGHAQDCCGCLTIRDCILQCNECGFKFTPTAPPLLATISE
jgi:hypothetical protein